MSQINPDVTSYLKATFFVHKLILKNVQMTILYINWSLYLIFIMIY